MSLSHQSVQYCLQSGQRLTQAEQAAVDEHLAACPDCRAYAAFHQTLLKTLPAGNVSLRHSEREIRQQINNVTAKLEQRRWSNRIFRSTLSLAGVAGALILLLVILIYIPRMMPARPTQATQAMLAPQATRLISSDFSSGSSPIPTPTPSAKSPLPFLTGFPIQPGTTWEYTNTGYTQSSEDPKKLIQGTSRIKESIASVKTFPPYTIVHIQGNKTMVSADAGWQENGTFGLGDYEYWYVIQNNQVYLSYTAPDPTQMKPNQMKLAYQFPLSQGAEWCPGPAIRGNVENPTPSSISQCELRRVVMNVGSYQSQVGELKSCYEIHDIANSGDVITQFCEGVGIVSVRYDHSGSQFGSDQELVSFTEGKESAHAPAPAKEATSVPDDIERLPSPDGQWAALYQKDSGRLEIEDGQGNRVRVEAAQQALNLIPAGWSPDSRYLLFWQGMNSASALMDGFPLASIEASTGKTFQITEAALLNTAYSSWAPDGHALVFTNGGYRSAQMNKWLSLYTPAKQQVIDLVSKEKLVPGAVAWSPDGKTIAFAAVDGALAGPANADDMGWDNPAIAGRRIYLLDPNTGITRRLDSVEAYQDVPRWGENGRLYFVQLEQDQAHVMATDPTNGTASVTSALPGCQAARPTPAGVYGQVDWNFLFDACLAIQPAGAPTPAAASPAASLQAGLAPAVAVKGQIAYIGTGAHLAAIDIGQPAAPRLAAQSPELPGEVIKIIPLPNGPGQRVAASAGRYIAVFDTAAPDQLGLITQSKLPGPVTALILDMNTNWIYAGGALEGDAKKGFVTILDATPPDTLDLLATIQLPAPVQSLALAKSVLYVAQNGDLPKISAIPLVGTQFGAPVDVHFSALPIYSMTTAGDILYIGFDQVFSALSIADPMQPKGAWDMDQNGGKPLPGKIFGFELRASAIYIAGLDGSGKPFRLAVTPPQPIKASSTVDTASYIAVASGQLLVAGDPLEIYDIRDPQNIKRIGSYPLP